jgi:hypothetical protein
MLARALALAVMLCALMALAAPFAAAATGHTCVMACCAALPEHDAESCGAHDKIAPKPVGPVRDPDDPLCRPAKLGRFVNDTSETETVTIVAQPGADVCATDDNGSSDLKANSFAHFAALRVGEACGQECGTCGSSAIQIRNDRQAAVQPIASGSGSFELRINSYRQFAPMVLRRSQGRRTVPRGPPPTPQI